MESAQTISHGMPLKVGWLWNLVTTPGLAEQLAWECAGVAFKLRPFAAWLQLIQGVKESNRYFN
jgi:hypothetical protein